MENITPTQEIASNLANLPLTGCEFISISNYENKSTGEVSNYTINAGISYENAKKKDIETAEKFVVTDEAVKYVIDRFHKETTEEEVREVFKVAREAVIKSLKGTNKDTANQKQAQQDAYTNHSPAIRQHNETKECYVYGLLQNRTVVKEATEPKKVVKSGIKVLAQNYIKKNFRTAKFRNFKISDISEVKIKGDTLIFG